MQTSCSTRSLVNKLGIKSAQTLLFLHAPDNYINHLLDLPSDVIIKNKLQHNLVFIQFFTKSKQELEKIFPKLKSSLAHEGSLWISWPKLKSKIATDLNENIIREIGLMNGLVDIKVCAVDDTWSGLKFVYRLNDRKKSR